MEKENADRLAGSPGETPTGEEALKPNELAKPAGGRNEQQKIADNERGSLQEWSPQPTVLTLQDLLDLPRQILPEQTYIHLRNAGREAILAVVSLLNSLSNSRRSAGDDKVRRRIDVD
jgi:hypothetical protein